MTQSLLNKALNELPPAERDKLFYALEVEQAHWCVWNEYLVGVHLKGLPQLRILEERGYFYLAIKRT